MPERKRPIRRPRCRWADNVMIDFEELGWSSVNWIDLAQDTENWRGVVNAVMNVRVP
jgi:hypothetical protein